jgi:hypothetical protein
MKIFNGTITIKSTRTGDHRTFKLRTQKRDSKFAPGERVLSLMTGPDNVHSYRGFAFVKNDGRVFLWRKNRTPLYNTYAKMVIDLMTNGTASAWAKKGYVMMLEKACAVCNRKLTNPESIETGVGPECGRR